MKIAVLRQHLEKKYPKKVDLTDAHDLDLISDCAAYILENATDTECINILEKMLLEEEASSIFPLLSIKIARSMSFLSKFTTPVKVSVVFAMYKEHNRIRTKEEHPHGENFLVRKYWQMSDLFRNFPNISWELIAVDDGCPEKSGEIARQIIDKNQIGDKVKVLFLADAIKQNLEVSKPMTSTSDSQKGGAIAYGMWYAAQDKSVENHIIAYTDADLSTHLGQLGLLINPIINHQKYVAVGSRRANGAVVIKQGKRNDRGKLFIYLWKRMIEALPHITDTQCGFKAYKREMVSQIITGLTEKKFAFDIELLIKARLLKKDPIAIIPIAWIDSEAASTTTDLQPYLRMLQAIAKMYQKYLPPSDKAAAFADFILGLNEDDFAELLNHIPNSITSREPTAFSNFDEVTVDDLKKR